MIYHTLKKSERNKYIKIAEELWYPKYYIAKIALASTEEEVIEILSTARKEMAEKEYAS